MWGKCLGKKCYNFPIILFTASIASIYLYNNKITHIFVPHNNTLHQQPGFYCLGHAPVIDGPGNFLPDDPLRLREAGEYSQIPLMSGWNAEDGSLYVVACECGEYF